MNGWRYRTMAPWWRCIAACRPSYEPALIRVGGLCASCEPMSREDSPLAGDPIAPPSQLPQQCTAARRDNCRAAAVAPLTSLAAGPLLALVGSGKTLTP